MAITKEKKIKHPLFWIYAMYVGYVLAIIGAMGIFYDALPKID